MNAYSEFNLAERMELAKAALPEELRQSTVFKLLELSLAEDLAPAGLDKTDPPFARLDITSCATILPQSVLKGKIFSKEAGVAAGLPVADAVFRILDPAADFLAQVADGDSLEPGEILAYVAGNGQALLAAERTALNFVGRMSGIATLTRRYVEAVAHTQAGILDTRKTAPGLRQLDKYAVRMGGGGNHRMGLYDEVLIKNNHIDAAGSVGAALKRVKEMYSDHYKVVVEVRTLGELRTALELNPSRILLDNMDNDTLRTAVEIAAGKVPLEASGGVNLDTAAAIAETGVDYLSCGSLTHSARTLDISMHLDFDL